MKAKEIYFEYEKETKNKIRYTEESDGDAPPIIQTLYIPKWYAKGTKRIKVTLEEVGETEKE